MLRLALPIIFKRGRFYTSSLSQTVDDNGDFCIAFNGSMRVGLVGIAFRIAAHSTIDGGEGRRIVSGSGIGLLVRVLETVVIAEIPPPINLLRAGAAKSMSLKTPTVHLLLVIPVLLIILALATIGFPVCAGLPCWLHRRHQRRQQRRLHRRLHRRLLRPLLSRLFCWLHRRLRCRLIRRPIFTPGVVVWIAFRITAHRAIDGAEGPRIVPGDDAVDSSTAGVLETVVKAEISPLIVLPLAGAASLMGLKAPTVRLLIVIPVLLVILALAPLFRRSLVRAAPFEGEVLIDHPRDGGGRGVEDHRAGALDIELSDGGGVTAQSVHLASTMDGKHELREYTIRDGNSSNRISVHRNLPLPSVRRRLLHRA
jgi:hypothetical protein